MTKPTIITVHLKLQDFSSLDSQQATVKQIGAGHIPRNTTVYRSRIDQSNVRQFAPQTIRPRQLAPSIQTISPHYLDD